MISLVLVIFSVRAPHCILLCDLLIVQTKIYLKKGKIGDLWNYYKFSVFLNNIHKDLSFLEYTADTFVNKISPQSAKENKKKPKLKPSNPISQEFNYPNEGCRCSHCESLLREKTTTLQMYVFDRKYCGWFISLYIQNMLLYFSCLHF